MHGRRDAAQDVHEVGVVDVQVDGRAPAAVGVGDPARPVGLRDHPGQVSGQQPAVTARFHRVQGEGELVEERQDVGDHELAPAGSGGGQHRVGILQAQRDGFLDEHILARFQGADGERGVLVVRDAEVHQPHARIVQEVVDRGMGRDPGEVRRPSGRAEVPLDPAPVAGAVSGVPAADGRHASPREGTGRLEVGHAHEADADDSDPDHPAPRSVWVA